MNNFWQRIITGTVFIAVVIGSIIYGPLTFQILFGVIALLSLDEFYKLCSGENKKPNRIAGLLTGLITYAVFSLQTTNSLPANWEAILPSVFCIILFAELYRKNKEPFTNIAFTILGILYAVVPFVLLYRIAFISGLYNSGIIIGYFVLLWSSDSFAYVFGNLMGKRRLFERISPKKSWEGSIGGGLTTIGVSYILWTFYPELSLQTWMIMAVLIVVAGTYGDLTESMFKRSLNVKDSGSLLPGHGGLLDRFDGLLMSVPFVWAYLELFA